MKRPDPIVEFDPFSADTVRDPYAAYEQLRDREPLHWSPTWGLWVLSRYADVRVILQDERFSNRHSVDQLGVQEGLDLGLFGRVRTLPSTDPPYHTRLRKLVNRAFTPAAVQERSSQIAAIVTQQLERAAERGQLRIVEDLAAPLPTLAIAGMLGLPLEDAAALKQWSDDLVVAFESRRATAAQLQAATAGARQLEDYFRDELRTRTAANSDLLVRLRDASEGDDALTEEEIITTCILLMVAGNETTTSLIANGMFALLHNPAELEKLQRDPGLVPTAVEEFLRYYGPIQMSIRHVIDDVQFPHGTVPKGDSVAGLLASANRDPRQFPDAGELRVDRTPNEHVAFGRGRHFCLGAPLARLEAAAAFTGLLRGFDGFELADSEASKWVGSMQTRRVDELVVRVSPKKALAT